MPSGCCGGVGQGGGVELWGWRGTGLWVCKGLGLEGVSWGCWDKGPGLWGVQGCGAGGQLQGFGCALGVEHVGEGAVGYGHVQRPCGSAVGLEPPGDADVGCECGETEETSPLGARGGGGMLDGM